MTDETPTGRDSSGRFIRQAAEKANVMSRTTSEGIHPMSKVLFGWTEHRRIGAILLGTFAILSLLLVGADLLVDRHEKISFASSVGFYGIWGFMAFSFVVLMGWPLGQLLRRKENYYGDAGGPPRDIDPELEVDEAGRVRSRREGEA